jgi:hypothetical protein
MPRPGVDLGPALPKTWKRRETSLVPGKPYSPRLFLSLLAVATLFWRNPRHAKLNPIKFPYRLDRLF